MDRGDWWAMVHGVTVRPNWETKHECTHTYSLVYTNQVFFIHLFVSGHLGWFHVMDTVNSAAVNTGVHYLFELWFSPDICPGVRLLDHMVVLYLLYICLFLTVLGSSLPLGLFSSCGERGPHSSCSTRASLAMEHMLRGTQTSAGVACGVWTQ